MDLDVAVVEPYYGGSHKSFLNGLKRHLPLRFKTFSLPARKWKWRMRLGAPYFAGQLKNAYAAGFKPACILASSMLDIACFRGLLPPELKRIPLICYFHENQFAYPVQHEDVRDFHFSLTNFTSALAADVTLFNSEYNRCTFLDGVRQLLKIPYDMDISEVLVDLERQSKVIHPGLDFSDLDAQRLESPSAEQQQWPVLIWNHRWEHDKNPELFFQTLFQLADEKVPFRVVVLGQKFRDQPRIFKQAAKLLGDRIIHMGYVRDKKAYYRWLLQGDIVVSTADHEFYGMSVIEAVRAGCRPLLPNRLSYRELFPEEFLYNNDSDLYPALKGLLRNQDHRLSPSPAMTEPFSWSRLAPQYLDVFTACSAED